MRINLTESTVPVSAVLPTFCGTYRPDQALPSAETPHLDSWTDEAQEFFIERAGLLEYEGGLARQAAEQGARAEVHRVFGMTTFPSSNHAAPVATRVHDGLEDVFGPLVPEAVVRLTTVEPTGGWYADAICSRL